MPSRRKTKLGKGQLKPASAENIARLADCGKNVSRFFSNAGRMMAPIKRPKGNTSELRASATRLP